MLKVIRVTGPAGSGKTRALEIIQSALIAQNRQVLMCRGNSTSRGIGQALRFYVSKCKPIARTGWRRLLPGALFATQYLEGPPTVLIDECSERLLADLHEELEFIDAFVVVVSA